MDGAGRPPFREGRLCGVFGQRIARGPGIECREYAALPRTAPPVRDTGEPTTSLTVLRSTFPPRVRRTKAMRSIGSIVLTALLLPVSLASDGGNEAVRKGLDAIRAEDAMAHVKVLASDEFEGRDTATEGCEKAAQYLCEQFEKIGLEPFGDVVDGKRTFRQTYPLSEQGFEDSSGLTVVRGDGTKRLLRYGSAIVPLTSGLPKDVEEPVPVVDGGVVDLTVGAAGAPDSSQTPAALSLAEGAKGAFVVLKVKGFENMAPNEMSRKLAGLKDAGVAGAILLPSGEGEAVSKEYARRYRFARANVRGSQLRPGKASAAAPRRLESPPILVLSDVKDAEGLAGAKASWTVRPIVKEKSAANIVGLVRGTDPALSKEFVVHSAHYDHVGRQGNEIWNGADDNASGTAAVLEIAKAYKATTAPRRSIVLLLVSGEEKGLWGSDFFAKNPPVELASIVANVNTDMVGRSLLNGKVKPEYMLMTPSAKHPKFNTLAQRALELGPEYGFPDMPSGDVYWKRSDHYNFSKNGIPVMFLCNGEHEDYHQPTDTADKIDPDKIARSARLAFHLGYEVAMADGRPHDVAVKSDKDSESKPASRPGAR